MTDNHLEIYKALCAQHAAEQKKRAKQDCELKMVAIRLEMQIQLELSRWIAEAMLGEGMEIEL